MPFDTSSDPSFGTRRQAAGGLWHGNAVPLLLLAASIGSLAAAFAGQHLFGLEPCILCLYERVPYAVAGVLALILVVVPLGPTYKGAGLALIALVFAAGAALAAYHVGVEEHWWEGFAGCSGTLPDDLPLDDPGALLAKPVKPCDEVDFRLLGLSLAGWNVVSSLALGGLAAAATYVTFRSR